MLAKIRFCMENARTVSHPIPQLLRIPVRAITISGADVVVALMCWMFYFCSQLGIVILPWYVPVVIGVAVWGAVLFSRLLRVSRRTEEIGLRFICPPEHGRVLCALMLVLLLLLLVSLGFFVLNAPIGLVRQLIVLTVVGLCARLLLWRRDSLPGCICLGLGYMSLCSLPGLFYSFVISPLNFILRLPFWFAVMALALFLRLRRSPQPPGVGMQLLCSLVALGGLADLLPRSGEGGYMAAFCPVFAGAVIMMWALMLLRGRVSDGLWYSIGWPLMSIPPLVGLFFL